MIAMALACDPKVLIADEPTTALDVTIQAGVLDLMRDIRERLGTAIILITHNLGVVADIADRVLVMYAGRKAEEAPVARPLRGAAAPVHDRPARRDPAAVRGDGEDAERPRLREIPGRVPSLRELPAMCAFADRCPRADEPSARERARASHVRPGPPRRLLPPWARMKRCSLSSTCSLRLAFTARHPARLPPPSLIPRMDRVGDPRNEGGTRNGDR